MDLQKSDYIISLWAMRSGNDWAFSVPLNQKQAATFATTATIVADVKIC